MLCFANRRPVDPADGQTIPRMPPITQLIFCNKIRFARIAEQNVRKNREDFSRLRMRNAPGVAINQPLLYFARMTKRNGGRRPGAGRPRGTVRAAPTTTMRIPVALADQIRQAARHGVPATRLAVVPAVYVE